MPIDGSVLPKPPVTWVVSFEFSEAERAAYALFFYRLKDGVVATGLSEHDNAVVLNRSNDLYTLLKGASVSTQYSGE